MLNLNSEQRLEEARRQEAIRRAKKNHASDTSTSNQRPALARLGSVLSTIGDSLQERYGEMDLDPTPNTNPQSSLGVTS